MSEKGLSTSEMLALAAGKLSALTIRLSGLGLASNLPGKLSRRIAPELLGHLASQSKKGVLAVTGTNGKSTSSGLLSSILSEAGLKVVHNRQGANLPTGITACAIDFASWTGQLDADYCLFETDEAALPVVAKEMSIGYVLVTNLFRDQLDRFGELDTTARLITKGIMENKSFAILNADDPNVAQMVPDSGRLFYGIETVADNPASRPAAEEDGLELSYCPACAAEYGYKRRFYGQLGHYICSGCGKERPKPDVYAEDLHVGPLGSQFTLVFGERRLAIELPLSGMFNVYNALAAAALSFKLGVEDRFVKAGLCRYSTLFGRSEQLVVDGKRLLIQLIKNPAGASQAVRAAASDSGAKFLISINDNYADGRDVSWLWDADFEQLAECKGPFVVSGLRCYDMAVRLKYAGVDPSFIVVEASLDKALQRSLELCAEGDTLWLMPTYTCLLDLQKIMKARGCPLSCT